VPSVVVVVAAAACPSPRLTVRPIRPAGRSGGSTRALPPRGVMASEAPSPPAAMVLIPPDTPPPVPTPSPEFAPTEGAVALPLGAVEDRGAGLTVGWMGAGGRKAVRAQLDRAHAGAGQVVDRDGVIPAVGKDGDGPHVVQVHRHRADVAGEPRPLAVRGEGDVLVLVVADVRHHVVAGLPVDRVAATARVPDEPVVPGAPKEHVVPGTPVEEVAAVATVQRVVAVLAEHLDFDELVAEAGVQRVVAVLAEDLD